jgi:hypothetical protein
VVRVAGCTSKGRKTNWIGHIWHRNCLLKHVTEGKTGRIKVTGRHRRLEQLQDDLKEMKGYWKLKEEAQDRILCKTDYGMNE